jgi:hypothetical protein
LIENSLLSTYPAFFDEYHTVINLTTWFRTNSSSIKLNSTPYRPEYSSS